MNPYDLLEIKPGATADEIKTAYHRLAKQWHPDRFTGPEKEQAEHRFRQLTEAFNMVKSSAPAARPIELDHNKPQASDPSATIPSAPAPGAPTPIVVRPADVHTATQDWYANAKKAYEGNRFGEALGLIQYALKLDSEKWDYHALQAKILEAMGTDKRSLVGALENCLRLNNRDADAAIKLAETYQALGMYARATRYWEWARNLAPDHPYFVKQRASAKEKAMETAEGLGGTLKMWVDQAKDALSRITKR
ncbi:MAG: J domain-containing protein [Acidobacteria bacterium]|nr:J domain-containing protein [Acidobacteriota bacterium]